jgi:uncharacterized protein involved in exopolysaccharide biosynthesis
MTFDDILRELRRCRFLIFFTTCLGIGAAVAYWFWAPEEYESFARILVLPKDPTMASATRETEKYERDDVSDDLLATHLELMRSDAVVEAALATPDVKSITSFEPHLKEDETVSDYVARRLWVYHGGDDEGKDARIINVGFRHFDA